jgi:hypothetical protein
MSRVSFTSLATGTPAVDQVQGYIATALNPLLQLPFASGNRVQAQDLSTADTIVDHGLEQKPEGWIILKQDAAQVIYESATVNDFPETTVILKAGGTVTCDLFFF